MYIPDFTALHTSLNNGDYPAPSDTDLTQVSLVDLHELLDGIETEYRNADTPDDLRYDNIHDRIVGTVSAHITGNLIDKDPSETFDEIDNDKHWIIIPRGVLRQVLSKHEDNKLDTITGNSATERDIVHSALVETFANNFRNWFNWAVLNQNTVIYIRIKRDPVPSAAANIDTPDVYESVFLDVDDPRIISFDFNDRSLATAVDRATTAHEKAMIIAGHLNDRVRVELNAHRYTDHDTMINLSIRSGRASADTRNTTVTTCPPGVITDHITREPLHTWQLTHFH